MSETASVIDLHVHYYTNAYVTAVKDADTINTYRRGDGRLVAEWRSGVTLTVVDPHPGPEERVETMDEVGVATQVLSVPSPNAYFLPPEEAEALSRSVNNEFAEIVRSHPRRFESLAILPMLDLDRSIAVLDEALDDLGMKGVMILSNIDGIPLDDPRFEPFWEMADERGLLVYVHPTGPNAPHYDENALAIAVGFFSESTLAIARLAYSGVFHRYPGIRWVFSHLGGTTPFMLPRLDSYWRQFETIRERCPEPPSSYVGNLVFDTASTHRPAIVCARDTLGVDRLVFGSDYPHVPGGTGPYLEALDALEVEGAAYAELVGGRAATLLSGRSILTQPRGEKGR
ncbi:MAG: amidohydrolase family protein [Acidimicrobiia bacterium]